MGFYVRKYVKAGPFRLNLSKSGLGVSVGRPGFRVGSGPRGNYVHMGRYGLYYRTAYYGKPLFGGSRAHRTVQQPLQPHIPDFPTYSPSDVVVHDVTGATAVSLVPTVGDDVVKQLNAAAARRGWGLPAALGALLLGLVTMMRFGELYGLFVWLALAPLCWWLFLHDKAVRTVVLFYDVNDTPATWFESLVEQWGWLTGSQKLWRVVQSGRVATTYQFKTNSGASNVISRIPIAATTAGPKHLATNVVLPSLNAHNSSLYFLPDRVLLREGKRYSDISYQHLHAFGSQTQFIESQRPLPSDGTQVGQTWRYVNVKGGPDRRYANNPILPIMIYGRLDLSSPEGLSWQVQTSRVGAATAIASVLSAVPAVEHK